MRPRRRIALWLGLLLTGACDGTAPPPGVQHVVLLTVDTLRADHLGAYGGERGFTPALDALAARSQRFTTSYAPAPFTLPSITALMTGRYPGEIGVESNRAVLPEGLPTLAGLLRAHGFRTGAVVSNPVLAAKSGLDAGFDHYDAELPDREATRRDYRERVAPRTTQAALAMLDRLLEKAGSRVFLWVHYQDPHGPYAPPPELRERFLPGERARPDGGRKLRLARTWRGMGALPRYQYLAPNREVAFYRAGYRGEVAYMDAALGRLLEGLRERGLLERSLLLFTADHGEGLGEGDYWFAHGEYLDEASLRVPLLLYAPGAPAATRKEVVSLVDVLPTLAALLDLEPGFAHSGLDLTTEMTDRAIFFTTGDGAQRRREGLLEAGYKLVRAEKRLGAERIELFRLPDEDRDLSDEEPERARALLDRLEAHDARRGEAAARQLSPEEREVLRELGYAED